MCLNHEISFPNVHPNRKIRSQLIQKYFAEIPLGQIQKSESKLLKLIIYCFVFVENLKEIEFLEEFR